MNFLLDTCVVSELTRPKPQRRVVRWIRSEPETRLHLSVLTIGELHKGIERLPDGRKRKTIEAWLNNELRYRFFGRILPIDDEVAERWGLESAEAEQSGTPLPVIDGLLAATGLVHGMTVVTRNTKDMRQTGAKLLNPWES
ncbi:MAG: type II toxin-antitoxin system VapC family toxin [Pirellulales bacterium]